VFFVGTGTAANSLALSAVNRPGGVSFCHSEAHVIADECGAPEFFSQGARLAPVEGAEGKMDPFRLEAEIARYPKEFVHGGQPMAITLTQATEAGTVYNPDEIRAISKIAKAHGLPLHMDGARFANALVALDLTPEADDCGTGGRHRFFRRHQERLLVRRGAGLSRPCNGQAGSFHPQARRHSCFSKSRFISRPSSTPISKMISGSRLPATPTAMSARLQAGILASPNARLGWHCPMPTRSFPSSRIAPAETLAEKGAMFYEWSPAPLTPPTWSKEGETMLRLVTSFATTEDDVDRFVDRWAEAAQRPSRIWFAGKHLKILFTDLPHGQVMLDNVRLISK
jgi:threonine aldolase